MSLINDMLKDLERRNPNAAGASAVGSHVHSVAPEPGSSVKPWLILGGLLIAAAIAAALFWINRNPPAAMVTPPPALPAAASPAAAPAAVEVALAPPEPALAVEPVPETGGFVQGLDRELSMPPRSDAEAASAVSQKRNTSPEMPPATDANVAPDSSPSSEKTNVASKPAMKTTGSAAVKQVSPQQRSENQYRQAITLIQQGRVAEAQEALQQALSANVANHDARQLLVGLMLDAKRNAEAISLLREGLLVDPAQSGFSMALARLLVEAGDRRNAMSVLEKGLPTAGDDAEYHAFMANLLQREERHADAVQHFLVALRSNPAMPNWLIGIGISLQAENMVPDAIAAFQRALDTAQLSPELQQFAEQRLKQLRQQDR